MKSKRTNPRRLSRRHFLRGTGGAILALPFLPSVTTRAFAAEPAAPPPKCFFSIATDHGGVWAANMYPDASVLGQQTEAVGRTIRFGDLPTGVVNAEGQRVFSEVARAAALTPSLATKFNILRGLDIPWRIGHHNGGHLGNFAEGGGQTINGGDARPFMTATIDQFIAWHDGFYTQEDLTSRMTQRSFNVRDGRLSWNFASPSTRTGDVVQQPHYRNNQDLFDFFFSPGSSYNGVDAFIIDRVKASYDRLRKHPRLSRGDRMRLDQHVERMFEIERKLEVSDQIVAPTRPTQSTTDIDGNGDFNANRELNATFCSLMNDVIVAAFASGVSRVGTWMNAIKFTDQMINDWHGNVAHGGFGDEDAQGWAVTWNQGTFEHIMVDLAQKMDAVAMSDGSTLLDNSLIMFTSEAGQLTHHTSVMSYPVITAGSAGGFFNTGLYVDFGNKSVLYDDLAELQSNNPLLESESPGLYYNQYLANVLMAMDISPSAFEIFRDFGSGEPIKGYGVHHVDAERAADYALARDAMGDKLPVVTT